MGRHLYLDRHYRSKNYKELERSNQGCSLAHRPIRRSQAANDSTKLNKILNKEKIS